MSNDNENQIIILIILLAITIVCFVFYNDLSILILSIICVIIHFLNLMYIIFSNNKNIYLKTIAILNFVGLCLSIILIYNTNVSKNKSEVVSNDVSNDVFKDNYDKFYYFLLIINMIVLFLYIINNTKNTNN